MARIPCDNRRGRSLARWSPVHPVPADPPFMGSCLLAPAGMAVSSRLGSSRCRAIRWRSSTRSCCPTTRRATCGPPGRRTPWGAPVGLGRLVRLVRQSAVYVVAAQRGGDLKIPDLPGRAWRQCRHHEPAAVGHPLRPRHPGLGRSHRRRPSPRRLGRDPLHPRRRTGPVGPPHAPRALPRRRRLPRIQPAHSLRVGFVTYAHLRGASDRAIAHQTPHRSLARLGQYIRIHEAWEDDAATQLGF